MLPHDSQVALPIFQLQLVYLILLCENNTMWSTVFWKYWQYATLSNYIDCANGLFVSSICIHVCVLLNLRHHRMTNTSVQSVYIYNQKSESLKKKCFPRPLVIILIMLLICYTVYIINILRNLKVRIMRMEGNVIGLSSQYLQEVFMAQFSLYVHIRGLMPNSFITCVKYVFYYSFQVVPLWGKVCHPSLKKKCFPKNM